MRNRYGESSTTQVVTVLSRKGEIASGSIGPFGGQWGDWAETFSMCPSGYLAYGFQDKVEQDQGDGHDDTALNGIALWCVNLPDTQSNEYATSAYQRYGDWSETVDCGDRTNYIVGARLRIEPDQGHEDDDTGGVDVEFKCLGHPDPLSNGGHNWGSWEGWQYCSKDTAICGLMTRIEGEMGPGWKHGHDDTALNDVRFKCCYTK